MRKIFINCFILVLLFGCTKVTDLSDEVKLTGFKVTSVTPSEIELGEPYIAGDTIHIPVLRGVTLFPLVMSAVPEYSSQTEQAVPTSSFESFDKINFDLDDIDLNSFLLVAKSGYTKPYYIKLEIEDQSQRNDFIALNIQDNPDIAPRGFINPAKRTIDIYALQADFPVTVKAKAVLSDSAYIRYNNNTLDSEQLSLNFGKFGDSLVYIVEAENGASQSWKVFFKQAIEATGGESADIKQALSLNASKQTAAIKTPGYQVNEIATDSDKGEFVIVVAPLSRSINVTIMPVVAPLSNTQLMGYVNSEELVFENYTTTHDFLLLDGRTGYYKKWKFTLVQGDIADIHDFPFSYHDNATPNYITVDTAAMVIDNVNRKISVKLRRSSNATRYWPFVITPGDVKHSPGSTLNADSLVFANINDIARFTITTASGIDVEWAVNLIAPAPVSDKADVDSVKIISASYPLMDNDIIVNASTQEIFIDLKDKEAFPLRVQPFLYISAGAEFISFQNGDFMEFNTFTDTIKIDVIAKSGDIKTWKFQLLEKGQLYNSDYEMWTGSGSGLNIDPIPGKGRGWSSANNFMVQGTKPVSNGSGQAAEMTTAVISLPRNLITSGTLFLGYFDMSTISLDKPRNMTKFGIPFEARPTAIALDAKYQPGPQYQKSVLVSGSGIGAIYELQNLEGEDRGQIWVELIHWSGEDKLNYAGEPTEGVTVLARGEYVISGTTGWSRLNIPLVKKEAYDQLAPTHLVVVMASSIEGHLFVGAKDSKLTVDNFELIY